ncbi:hypothetical protein O6H91_Y516400 [Diphasiastrum complanatum]|nr:hypothetical protein O6H91_Y516400 [Diphasiastrum complanatum]
MIKICSASIDPSGGMETGVWTCHNSIEKCKVEEEGAKRALDQASNHLREGKYEKALLHLKTAERLCPGLKGLPELLAITDVLLAASWKPCTCITNSQMKTPDWYRILKVDEKADLKTIKKRYKQLALMLHPDKNKNTKAEVAFKLASEAYTCLADKSMRRSFNLKRSKMLCNRCSFGTQEMIHEQVSSESSLKTEKWNDVTLQRHTSRSNLHDANWSIEQERLQIYRERARLRVTILAHALRTRCSRWSAELDSSKEKHENKIVDRKAGSRNEICKKYTSEEKNAHEVHPVKGQSMGDSFKTTMPASYLADHLSVKKESRHLSRERSFQCPDHDSFNISKRKNILLSENQSVSYTLDGLLNVFQRDLPYKTWTTKFKYDLKKSPSTLKEEAPDTHMPFKFDSRECLLFSNEVNRQCYYEGVAAKYFSNNPKKKVSLSSKDANCVEGASESLKGSHNSSILVSVGNPVKHFSWQHKCLDTRGSYFTGDLDSFSSNGPYSVDRNKSITQGLHYCKPESGITGTSEIWANMQDNKETNISALTNVSIKFTINDVMKSENLETPTMSSNCDTGNNRVPKCPLSGPLLSDSDRSTVCQSRYTTEAGVNCMKESHDHSLRTKVRELHNIVSTTCLSNASPYPPGCSGEALPRKLLSSSKSLSTVKPLIPPSIQRCYDCKEANVNPSCGQAYWRSPLQVHAQCSYARRARLKASKYDTWRLRAEPAYICKTNSIEPDQGRQSSQKKDNLLGRDSSADISTTGNLDLKQHPLQKQKLRSEELLKNLERLREEAKVFARLLEKLKPKVGFRRTSIPDGCGL